jgi:hypothetical protein
MHSLATAAAACGVNKSTVLRAIKSGKISATRNEHSEWQIDPAELHRVYPPIARTAAAPQNASADDVLAIKVAMAEDRLAELKGALEDMRGQRDSWQKMAESVKLLLPAPDQTPSSSWWPWRRAG